MPLFASLKPNFSRETKKEFLVVLSYFLISILATYPLIRRPASHVAYEGAYDAYYCLWSLWWSKTALFDLHTNMLHTLWHFYPQGTSVIFGPTQLHGTAILASPIQLLFPGLSGLVVEYNIIVLVSLVVSAYGAYLLSNHICHHRGAAFLAGIIYAFVPLRLFNIVRLQYFSLHWIPFFVLFFVKTLQARDKKNPLLAALFLSFILFDNMGYALHMSFLGALAFVFFLIPLLRKLAELAPLARRLVIFVLAIGVLTLPYTIQLAKEMRSNTNLQQFELLRVTLSGLVVPHSQSTIYGRHATDLDTEADSPLGNGDKSFPAIFRSIFSGVKNQVFLRYSLIVLFLYSTYFILRYDRANILWPVIAFFFLFLSFGSRIVVFEGFSLLIPTPYSILRAIVPPLRMARHTMDHLFHFTLGAAVTCSIGLSALLDRIERPSMKNVVVATAALVVTIESLIIPIKVTSPRITPAYEIIKADPAEFTITELPMFDLVYLSRQFLYQTQHRKKLLGGLIDRASVETIKSLDHPFTRATVDPSKYLEMPPASFAEVLEKDREFIARKNLKYIVVNELAYRNSAAQYRLSVEDLERFLKLNGYVKVYSDSDETLFKMPDL